MHRLLVMPESEDSKESHKKSHEGESTAAGEELAEVVPSLKNGVIVDGKGKKWWFGGILA